MGWLLSVFIARKFHVVFGIILESRWTKFSFPNEEISRPRVIKRLEEVCNDVKAFLSSTTVPRSTTTMQRPFFLYLCFYGSTRSLSSIISVIEAPPVWHLKCLLVFMYKFFV